ncbi:MAG: hypothetical protein ABH950_03580, partial [Candidatus Altiarchaeota archaeon]
SRFYLCPSSRYLMNAVPPGQPQRRIIEVLPGQAAAEQLMPAPTGSTKQDGKLFAIWHLGDVALQIMEGIGPQDTNADVVVVDASNYKDQIGVARLNRIEPGTAMMHMTKTPDALSGDKLMIAAVTTKNLDTPDMEITLGRIKSATQESIDMAEDNGKVTVAFEPVGNLPVPKMNRAEQALSAADSSTQTPLSRSITGMVMGIKEMAPHLMHVREIAIIVPHKGDFQEANQIATRMLGAPQVPGRTQ